MEVRKHPHDITHKKKWSEYLLEFLMLFLAVFLGFIAENMRESSVDMRKEKEYMHSLMQDLHAHISDIDSMLEQGSVVSEKLDSLIDVLNQEDPKTNAGVIYRLALPAGRVVKVLFTDRTSSQLKNSGNMRLVRNSNLSDSIMGYWAKVEVDEEIANRLIDLQSKFADVRVQIISNKYYEKRDPSNPLVAGAVKNDARLMNTDPNLIAQLSNRGSNRLVALYNYLVNLRETKEMAQRLIFLIKKEYHFE